MRGKRRTSIFKNKAAIIILILVIAVLCVFAIPFSRVKVSAGEKTGADSINYTTYVVQLGDTLWDIADEHLYEDFATHQAYIREVQRANRMESCDLYEGQLIIIPYDAEL